MNVQIVKATREDMDSYLRINTQCWNETYKGIIEDKFLEKINNELEDNIKKLKHRYNKNDHRYILMYNDKPVGMASCGYSRIDEYLNSGEIYSLYLIDEVKDKGFGKLLFEYCVNILKDIGYRDMIIGCLKDNTKANGFYKHMGGNIVLERKITIGNQEVDENIYYYKNI